MFNLWNISNMWWYLENNIADILILNIKNASFFSFSLMLLHILSVCFVAIRPHGTQAGLRLTMWLRLASNSRHSCLHLSNASIIGMCHCVLLLFPILKYTVGTWVQSQCRQEEKYLKISVVILLFVLAFFANIYQYKWTSNLCCWMQTNSKEQTKMNKFGCWEKRQV